jgi:ferredoxin
MERYDEMVRETARKLFTEDKIDLFIGFCKGTEPFVSRPCFVGAPDGDGGGADKRGGAPAEAAAEAADGTEAAARATVEDLTFDSFSAGNLAVYLPKLYEKDPHARKGQEKPLPRVGIAVKGCDMRSVMALVRELQVPRDKVVLVGVPCTGMVDRRKARKTLDERKSPLREVAVEGDTVKAVLADGSAAEIPKEDVLQDACLECGYPLPEGADILLEGSARNPAEASRKGIEDFEGMSPEERWSYFESEISRCIRCNACRQACPTCYCKVCFAEQSDMKWIGVSTDLSDTMMFHLIRIFHQAGRCVECDACYRACPMNIDLRTFTKKMAKDVQELFGYCPDFDPEVTPPLSTFTEKDAEEFITDPDKRS